MKKASYCVVAIALVSSQLSAQTVPPVVVPETAPPTPVEPVAPAVPQDVVLNSGIPITLAVAEEVNSSTHRAGDTFRLTVSSDVTVDKMVVIPKGTPALGEITWRTGKGAFGKSGKIEFSLRHIDLKGKSIPVTGNYRQDGEGNTVATGVGIIAVGVFAGFITGKRARLPIGRELMAQLAQPVQFTADGQLSPAFDAARAVAEAEAKTPLGQCKAAANALTKESSRKKAIEECYKERME